MFTPTLANKRTLFVKTIFLILLSIKGFSQTCPSNICCSQTSVTVSHNTPIYSGTTNSLASVTLTLAISVPTTCYNDANAIVAKVNPGGGTNTFQAIYISQTPSLGNIIRTYTLNHTYSLTNLCAPNIYTLDICFISDGEAFVCNHTPTISIPNAPFPYQVSAVKGACNTYSFNFSGDPALANPQWHLGNGVSSSVLTTSTSGTYTYNYPTGGAFTASLVGSNLPCPLTINVNPPQFVGMDFTHSITSSCNASTIHVDLSIVNFSASPVQYSFSINNSTPLSTTLATSTHTSGFSAGINTITLLASNGSCTASITKTINVTTLSAYNIFATNIGCMTFSLSYTGPPLTSAQWAYGDGANSPIQNNPATTSTIHTYPSTGNYVVSLVGEGLYACPVQTVVTATNFTVADFNYTINSICNPALGIILEIPNFNSSFSYAWQINGFVVPTFVSVANYTNHIINGGNIIKLTVTNGAGCSTTITKMITIGTPLADFQLYSQNLCVGDGLSVLGVSAGGGLYEWTISKTGMTTASLTGLNPAYIFTASGVYQVSLTITSTVSSGTQTAVCTNGYAKNITVSTTPDATFTLSPLACGNSCTIVPSATGIGATFTSYTINYGDGSSATANASSINTAHLAHNYSSSGVFVVQLILKNNNCSANHTQNVIINTSPVLSIFSSSDFICMQNPVSLTAYLNNLPTNVGTLSYTWAGPASFSSQQANISVSNGGVYQLTVTSNGACPINLTASHSVTALANPSISIVSIATLNCTQSTVSAIVSIPVDLQQQGCVINGTTFPTNPSASSAQQITLVNLVGGANYVNVSNLLSPDCQLSLPVIVPLEQASINLTVDMATSCTGNGAALASVSPAGAGTISWYTVNNYPLTALSTGNSINSLASGMYVAEYKIGHCTASSNFNISQPAISISKLGSNATCLNAAAPTTILAQYFPAASGAFTYSLYFGNNLISSNATHIFSLTPGSYSVKVSGSNCINSYKFVVGSTPNMNVTLNTNLPKCSDPGDISTQVSGGDGNYSYKWYWNSTLHTNTTHNLSLANLTAAASISVVVTDNSGCSVNSSIVNVAPPVPISLTSCWPPGVGNQNATTISGCDISACVTGGNAPYTFSWYKKTLKVSKTQWMFMYNSSNVFVAVNGTQTLTVPVPNHVGEIDLDLNKDSLNTTVTYPYWDFTGTPKPILNASGMILTIPTSTNYQHYYQANEDIKDPASFSYVTSYAGPSGQTGKIDDFTTGYYYLHVTDASNCTYTFDIGALTFSSSSTFTLVFDYVWGMRPIPPTVEVVDENLNEDLIEAGNTVLNELDECMAQKKATMKNFIANTCAGGANFKDALNVSYETHEHHHTLYYYDRAGRLTKTVPPEGVDYLDRTKVDQILANRNLSSGVPSTWPTQTHSMVTTYTYNSFGQLTSQKTPDGGITNFVYDSNNRLRFSQNAKQKAANPNSFSYTKYDELGRINEVGEAVSALVYPGLVEANSTVFPNNSFTGVVCNQITKTIYSTATPITYYGKPQRFTQNRVSYTHTDPSTNVVGDEYYTYYSYDSHGNVEWLVQDNPNGIGKNYIAYQYDLISGKVLKVSYNEKRSDRFFHRYVYDLENRLVRTETSRNGQLWDKDATYTYYPHGPLMRNQLGEDKVQGLDYVYTLNGWIKSINTPSLQAQHDPGGDNNNIMPASGNAQEKTAEDRFGMVLNYYEGDFKSTNSFLTSGINYNLASYSTGNYAADDAPALYNGNISSWVHSQLNNVTTAPQTPRADLFKYDVLNRIKKSTNLQANPGQPTGWEPIPNSVTNGASYYTDYSYDANGNILTLNRYDEDGQQMDELEYEYDNGPGGTADNNNKLTKVRDIITTTISGRQDLQGIHQYSYDATGNLIRETGSEMMGITGTQALHDFTTTIDWNVYGKIQKISKSILTATSTINQTLNFEYDAAGNRIKKEYWQDTPAAPDNKVDTEELTTTYYVRDAQGNTMAVYKKYYDSGNGLYKLDLIEQPIYGSDRLGQNVQTITLASSASYVGLSSPSNGVATISEYQNWISTSSKTQLLPNGGVTDNLCQCKVVLMKNNPGTSNYQNVQTAVQMLGIAQNGIAVAENLTRDLQFFVVLAKKYLGAADACLVFDKFGSLMKGTELISNINMDSKPVIVNLPGTKNYVIAMLDNNDLPVYQVVDMTLPGYGSAAQKMGEVISANNFMVSGAAATTPYGLHFTGREDHLTNTAVIYGSRYIQFGAGVAQGTTEIMSFNFGNSINSPQVMGSYQIPGCGSGRDGQIQISPDGDRLAWWQFDKSLAGFKHRTGSIYTFALDPSRTFVSNLINVRPISNAGSYGTGMLEFLKNNNELLYSQRGVYKEATGASTPQSRNVWRYDVVNFSTLASINPNPSNPMISYLYGEIKRGIDGNYYIPNMGKPVDQVHSYNASVWNSNATLIDTSYRLTSALPTQVFKIFDAGLAADNILNRSVGNKDYELKDHLANVRVVISDAKLIVDNGTVGQVDAADGFVPEVRSYTDYFAFGQEMPNRKFNAGSYRYGFNGKENDDEVKGTGNQQDYGLRTYDTRLGRFFSVDPLRAKFPWWSPYAFAGNTPIRAIDLDGGEILDYRTPFRLKQGKEGLSISYSYSEDLFEKEGMLATAVSISSGLAGKTYNPSMPLNIPLKPGGGEAQTYYTITVDETQYMETFGFDTPKSPGASDASSNSTDGMAGDKQKGQRFTPTNRNKTTNDRAGAIAGAIEWLAGGIANKSNTARSVRAKSDLNNIIKAYADATTMVDEFYDFSGLKDQGWSGNQINQYRLDIINFVVDGKLPNGQTPEYNREVERNGVGIITSYQEADAQKKLESDK